MTTETKVFIAIGLATLLILVGGVYWATKQNERLSRPLMGQEITVTGRGHVPQGSQIDYNSNPPTAGPHYADPAHAGIYDKAPADGNLVHSLEHGAVIIWYNPKLLQNNQLDTLKSIYNQLPGGKKIIVPRDSMDSPVAITSWGRVLKLQTIDEKQIKEFFDTNYERGPENAPI